jgi:hypothetical protein
MAEPSTPRSGCVGERRPMELRVSLTFATGLPIADLTLIRIVVTFTLSVIDDGVENLLALKSFFKYTEKPRNFTSIF